jgi:protein-S-isoprenylcysteine O-methyltransferase Ste14
MLNDPFFWAFASAIAIIGGNAIQGSPVVGRSTTFGVLVVAVATLGRVVMVLPAISQPRFAEGGLILYASGGIIVAVAIALMLPLIAIRPFTRPSPTEPLSTAGAFGLVRHPGYLANVLLGLGAAVAFGSTVGVLLTPIWAAAFWLHALIEEEALKSKYGASYEAYMARVRSRLIPGLPL